MVQRYKEPLFRQASSGMGMHVSCGAFFLVGAEARLFPIVSKSIVLLLLLLKQNHISLRNQTLYGGNYISLALFISYSFYDLLSRRKK